MFCFVCSALSCCVLPIHLKVSDTRPGWHVKDADIRQPRFVAWLGLIQKSRKLGCLLFGIAIHISVRLLYTLLVRYYVDLFHIYIYIYIYIYEYLYLYNIYIYVEGTFLYRMTGFGNTKSSALLVDGDVFFFYQIYFESRGKKRQIKEMIIVFSVRSLVTGTWKQNKWNKQNQKKNTTSRETT